MFSISRDLGKDHGEVAGRRDARLGASCKPSPDLRYALLLPGYLVAYLPAYRGAFRQETWAQERLSIQERVRDLQRFARSAPYKKDQRAEQLKADRSLSPQFRDQIHLDFVE